ncbi:hypothetical protein [Mycolicibacterium iranicum]|uniref:Uncharacterized protein n=1 Tax=Mycolicibacterium iranicum TaxID=912594 RepID=A0A178M1J4_MYCIR|nr:hypothetical protein [Mycolicibacterium iranicum]OAN40649.1 hypothetical protein A4X20_13785 [Mycolicibacterium iranicum]
MQVFTDRNAVSAFGSATVTVPPEQDHVDVTTIFGSMVVVVPDGVRVNPTGTVLFGSVNCENACRSSGPEVTDDVTGAFGSVAIQTVAENARD